MLDIYLDASHLSIYPPLFISPSGDSCIIAFIYQAKMQGSSWSCADLTLYWTSNLEQAAVYLYDLSTLKRVIRLCIQHIVNELIVCKWSHFVCFMLIAAHQDILSEIPLTVRWKVKYLLSQDILFRKFKITLKRQREILIHLNLWDFTMIIPTCKVNSPEVEFWRKISTFKERKKNSLSFVYMIMYSVHSQ